MVRRLFSFCTGGAWSDLELLDQLDEVPVVKLAEPSLAQVSDAVLDRLGVAVRQ